MDPSSLDTLRSNAGAASDNATNLSTDIPGLLSGLKSSLGSIFTKDNPMFSAREGALNTFLNAPSQTRSSLLPSNQPVVGGTPLNFSPTQQDAMVTANRNAALVPLAGLNSSIVSQGGNLSDILSSAGNIYQGQLKAATDKATNALGLYKAAIDEYNAIHSSNNQGGIGDLSSLIQAILGGSNTSAGGDWEVVPQPQQQPTSFNGSAPNLFSNSTEVSPGVVIPHIGAAPSQPAYNFGGLNLGGNSNSNGLSLVGGGGGAFQSNPYGLNLKL